MSRLYCLILPIFLIQNTFSQVQTYSVNGTAVMTSDDCFQLTQNGINGQIGSFFADQQIDLSQPFDFEFSMNFGVNDGNGADGMIFLLQNLGTDLLGNSGGAIGYEGTPDSLSMGIEFDTWQNTDRGDPIFDHIGMISQGSTSHNPPTGLSGTTQMSLISANVEDGQDHLARINWNPVIQELTVDFDCEHRLTQSIDLINDIFQGENLVYWGFTSSTGGANNLHSVCIINETESNIPEECVEPGEITLSAAGLPQGSFSWEPAIIFDDPSAQTVTANFQETTEIIIEYIHPCGTSGYTDTINIFINDIDLNVTSNVLNCYSDTVYLDGTSSDIEDVIYTWSTSDAEIIAGLDSSDAIGLGSGEYAFTVSDTTSGCTRSVNYNVPTDYTAPVLNSEVDGLLSCLMPIVQIQMIDVLNLGNYMFEWTTMNGNILESIEDIADVDLAGIYTGTMTYIPTGCSESIEILVENDPEFLNVSGLLQVPNIITPNGDELNDSFRAFYIPNPDFDLGGMVKDFNLEIYNRWGNLVYDTSLVTDPWKNFEETEGTYYYVLKYSDVCDQRTENLLKGTVHVIR